MVSPKVCTFFRIEMSKRYKKHTDTWDDFKETIIDLEDTRDFLDPLPLETYDLEEPAKDVKWIKVTFIDVYGDGGGLDYLSLIHI